MIFLSITGTFFSLLSYDRYQKRRIQKKWSALVAPTVKERLPIKIMPRKITIYLSAPPGDTLRPVREHFKQYVKPILVAGGLDWEVVEGKREGELRAGLAERVRKLREKHGEVAPEKEEKYDVNQGIQLVRDQIGIKDWDGVQGDLVIGRHTWKEYIQGLHEGWLGPMAPPKQQQSFPEESVDDAPFGTPGLQDGDASNAVPASYIGTQSNSPGSQEQKPADESQQKPAEPEPPKVPSPTPPYIVPDMYSSASLPPTPVAVSPVAILPFPHLLGFLKTPARTYRFLTRRRLADTTGRQVAALVLATRVSSFEEAYSHINLSQEQVEEAEGSSINLGAVLDNLDSSSASSKPSIAAQVLKDEERDWHKSVYAPDPQPDSSVEPSDSPTSDSSTNSISPSLNTSPDRPWRNPIVTDPRIEGTMTTFALDPGSEKRAEMALMEEDKKRKEERWVAMHKWVGWWRKEDQEKKGWEMGWEGDVDS